MRRLRPSEYPIIMSAESVRAILAGCKTQSRRVMKPQPLTITDDGSGLLAITYPSGERPSRRQPVYLAGDLLWVKETWGVCWTCGATSYRASSPSCEHDGIGRWRSPRYMPRDESRLTLLVIDVRCERLQDISEADASAEGSSKRDAFALHWDSINGKRGHPWSSNPWVRVVDFEVVA